ncbi:MAG: AmmeMemoRadiSam system protein A [Kiritimatiellae bacterium]|nr:AmmeMemoRadiSam system protein A [Kiritimatiellia bacterium]
MSRRATDLGPGAGDAARRSLAGVAVCGALMMFACRCRAAPPEETILTEADKQVLLNLARHTLYAYLRDGSIPQPDRRRLNPNLTRPLGCFVTLEKEGMGLRGCIGTFERERPLYENVIGRAIAAASHDTRFKPVQYAELARIKLEISVLTEPRPLPFDSPQDLLAKLRPEVDGVILQTPYGGSTFLPQVWEQLPRKEEFLSRLCLKHGAPADIWRRAPDRLRVSTYQAVVFGEAEYGRRVVGPNGAVVGKKGALLLGAVTPLREGLDYGRSFVPVGTRLAPGAIVSADSDIVEPR